MERTIFAEIARELQTVAKCAMDLISEKIAALSLKQPSKTAFLTPTVTLAKFANLDFQWLKRPVLQLK